MGICSRSLKRIEAREARSAAILSWQAERAMYERDKMPRGDADQAAG